MPRHYTERSFEFTWTYDIYNTEVDLETRITGTFQPGYSDTHTEPGEPDCFAWNTVEVLINDEWIELNSIDANLDNALTDKATRLACDYYSSDNLRFEAANV
jgi:hypothetical protein